MNAEVVALLKDHTRYIESLFYIQDKRQQLRKLKFNRMQQNLRETRTGRDVGLKARQMGFTTGILADDFCDTITTPNTVMVVMSHEDLATQRILAKVHCFYDNLPKGFRPDIHHDSSYQMSFPGLGSMIYIGTAGARAFGRGDTIHRFLGSEVAHWPPEKASTILAGVEEAVPDTGRITLESTANGEGGEFYERCMEALQGTGSYNLHFYEWWWDEEYAYEEGDERALPADRSKISLTPEEESLILKHGLTDAQIRWRRRKISERKSLFPQEYPEDVQTAFLSAARAYFPSDVLKDMLLMCRPPLRADKHGLQVWQSPRAAEPYAVGIDPAEGAPPEDEQGIAAPEGLLLSKCGLSVINARTLEHVASWDGYLEPNELAMFAAEVGQQYNTAMLAVERNNHGHAVLNTLVNWLQYPRIYRYRDPVEKGGVAKYGWLTTAKTRPQLLANFDALLRSRSFTTWDESLLFQARNLRHLKGGKIGMPPKLFDDKLFATMIACETRADALTGIILPSKTKRYGRNT